MFVCICLQKFAHDSGNSIPQLWYVQMFGVKGGDGVI